jgi:hypothetical protein
MREFFRRRIVEPVVTLLKQGITPERVARRSSPRRELGILATARNRHRRGGQRHGDALGFSQRPA